jgi:hypothetical protein
MQTRAKRLRKLTKGLRRLARARRPAGQGREAVQVWSEKNKGMAGTRGTKTAMLMNMKGSSIGSGRGIVTRRLARMRGAARQDENRREGVVGGMGGGERGDDARGPIDRPKPIRCHPSATPRSSTECRMIGRPVEMMESGNSNRGQAQWEGKWGEGGEGEGEGEGEEGSKYTFVKVSESDIAATNRLRGVR